VNTSLDSVFSWRSGSTAYQTYCEGGTITENTILAKRISL